MTDNEIIKVIKHCINKTCVNCKREDNEYHSADSCRYALLKDALDLINRQKAEIEEWKRIATNRTEEMYQIGYAAIKEFAERLKKVGTKVEGGKGFEGVFVMANNFQIDNLVKEMTEQ